MKNDEDLSQTIDESSKKEKRWKGNYNNGTAGALYGLGFIGAAIYELQHATSLLVGILGIIKALFWPGFLVYKLFQFLKI